MTTTKTKTEYSLTGPATAFEGTHGFAAPGWLGMLRRYLPFIALTDLVWEMLHLPLYTLWLQSSMQEQAFAVVHCTGGDLIIATTTLILALLLVGDRTWPARRFYWVIALATGFGVLYTIFSEWLNTVLRKSWAYSELMPVVPVIDTGFVSLLPWAEAGLFAVWLDGRLTADSDSDVMMLRAAVLDAQGQLSNEILLDEYVCSCCQTAAVTTSDGALVAYRDRSSSEIRDIAVVPYQNGAWTEPNIVYNDGWLIPGCPVNGPALAADGQRVAVTWFTAAQDQPRVLLAFSDNSGEHFSEPIRIDDGNPLGRVDLVLLADGAALASWLEAGPRGGYIRFRLIRNDGALISSVNLVGTGTGSGSEFPKLAYDGKNVFFAWTQPGRSTAIRSAILKLGD